MMAFFASSMTEFGVSFGNMTMNDFFSTEAASANANSAVMRKNNWSFMVIETVKLTKTEVYC